MLTHYDIPMLDPATWRLTVRGLVDRPISLDLETLKAMPRHTSRVTLECAGNGRAHLTPRPVSQPWLTGAVGTADWTGVRLVDLLEDAGIARGAVDVVFSGADHGLDRGTEDDYRRALGVADASSEEILVAYEMNGQPLPPQHGFPVRLVVPGWYGMAHVKWLCDIEVVDHAFEGFQNAVAYRIRRNAEDADDLGTPVTRIEPRALLVPPGFPDFMSRTRVVRPGTHLLEGRAWSGWGAVRRVEVSTDDGHLGRRGPRAGARPPRVAALHLPLGGDRRPALPPGARTTPRAGCRATSRRGAPAGSRTTPTRRSAWWSWRSRPAEPGGPCRAGAVSQPAG